MPHAFTTCTPNRGAPAPSIRQTKLVWSALVCLPGCHQPGRLAAELYHPDVDNGQWPARQHCVKSVIQSRDGYLWLGTRSGLARFDGVRFTVFDSGNTPEMQSPHVTCLFEDAEGAIWIGHETGELTCYQDGKFRAVPILAKWHGGKIYGIGADLAGAIWLLNGDGELARVKDWFVIPSPPGKAPVRVAMVRKLAGGFWIQRDDVVSELEEDHLRPVYLDQPPRNRYVQGIGASRDGGLWVMTEGLMLKWKNGRWIEGFGSAPWGFAGVNTLLETKGGTLAVATLRLRTLSYFSQPGAFAVLSHERVSRRLDHIALRRSRRKFVGGNWQQRPGHVASRQHHHPQPARPLAGARGPVRCLRIRMTRCGLAPKVPICTVLPTGTGPTLIKVPA